jgi:hypothetical protein
VISPHSDWRNSRDRKLTMTDIRHHFATSGRPTSNQKRPRRFCFCGIYPAQNFVLSGGLNMTFQALRSIPTHLELHQ